MLLQGTFSYIHSGRHMYGFPRMEVLGHKVYKCSTDTAKMSSKGLFRFVLPVLDRQEGSRCITSSTNTLAAFHTISLFQPEIPGLLKKLCTLSFALSLFKITLMLTRLFPVLTFALMEQKHWWIKWLSHGIRLD